MTRGTLVWIENEAGDCLLSEEFNGDMGMDMSCGKIAIEKLKNCKSLENFKDIVLEFLKDYGYIEDYSEEDIESGNILDKSNVIEHSFDKDYFGDWFSDYLYFVNHTGKNIETTDRDGKSVVICNGVVTAFNFGRKCGEYSND